MGVRLEWTEATSTGVSLLRRGEEAEDGQAMETAREGGNDRALVIGPLVIEGNYASLAALLGAAIVLNGNHPDVLDPDPDWNPDPDCPTCGAPAGAPCPHGTCTTRRSPA